MANVKDFTGSVKVDASAEVTPVTRQKIERVTPNQWPQMDINRLWDQRIILNERMMKAQQCGQAEIALQVQKGINTIDAILRQKAAEQMRNNEEKLL